MAANRGSCATSIGTGCSRAGPRVGDGDTRSPHTGSVSTKRPSISIRVVAWPSQVTASPAAPAGGAAVTSGTAPPGRPLPRWRSSAGSRFGNSSGRIVRVGSVLWNVFPA